MMKKGGKPVKPETKLGKEEILIPEEFIVNMFDGRTYVRAKIGLKGKEGFKGEELEHHNAEVCDAINAILKTTKPDEVITEQQVKKLKLRIAKSLNKIFKEAEEKKDGSDEKDSKKHKKSSDESTGEKKTKGEKSKDEKSSSDDEPEIPEGWDSAEGPILKVFFKTLATQ